MDQPMRCVYYYAFFLNGRPPKRIDQNPLVAGRPIKIHSNHVQIHMIRTYQDVSKGSQRCPSFPRWPPTELSHELDQFFRHRFDTASRSPQKVITNTGRVGRWSNSAMRRCGLHELRGILLPAVRTLGGCERKAMT